MWRYKWTNEAYHERGEGPLHQGVPLEQQLLLFVFGLSLQDLLEACED